ncbi:MAG TPA: hypothetical protein VF441_02850 [Acidimicrobiia bacterium]
MVIVSGLRIAASLPPQPTYLPDSRDYLATPQLLGIKPPLTPFIYLLLARNYGLIAFAQAAFGALAWGVLALTCRRIVGGAGGWFTFAAILFLSVSAQVATWDAVLLSESFSLSLMVLLIAAGLLLAERWETRRFVTFLVIAACWMLSRDTNAYIVVLLGLGALVCIGLWLVPRRAVWFAVPLVIMGAFGVWSINAASRWTVPFFHVTTNRILPDPEAKRYFVAHGMPVTRALHASSRGDEAFRHDPGLASFRRWADERGQRTYAGYLADNPDWVLQKSFTQDAALVSPLVHVFNYQYRPPLGWASRHAVAQPRPWVLLTVLAILGFAGYLVQRRSRRVVGGMQVALVIIALYPFSVVLTWVGDTFEIERHQFPATIAMTIAGALLVGGLLTAWTESRVRDLAVPKVTE